MAAAPGGEGERVREEEEPIAQRKLKLIAVKRCRKCHHITKPCWSGCRWQMPKRLSKWHGQQMCATCPPLACQS